MNHWMAATKRGASTASSQPPDGSLGGIIRSFAEPEKGENGNRFLESVDVRDDIVRKDCSQTKGGDRSVGEETAVDTD